MGESLLSMMRVCILWRTGIRKDQVGRVLECCVVPRNFLTLIYGVLESKSPGYMSQKWVCISFPRYAQPLTGSGLWQVWPHHEYGCGSRRATAGAPGQSCFLIRKSEPTIFMAATNRNLCIKWSEISTKKT